METALCAAVFASVAAAEVEFTEAVFAVLAAEADAGEGAGAAAAAAAARAWEKWLKIRFIVSFARKNERRNEKKLNFFFLVETMQIRLFTGINGKPANNDQVALGVFCPFLRLANPHPCASLPQVKRSKKRKSECSRSCLLFRHFSC